MRALFFLTSVLFCFGLSARANDGPPRVVADIAPVHGLVARVMQGVATPDLIVPPGASVHGYAMRPSEARTLSRAQLVFWVGPLLTPWLSDPIETLAPDAEHVTLAELDGTVLLGFREGSYFAPHDHDHGHGAHDAAEHAEEDHAHDEHAHDEHAHEGEGLDAVHEDDGHGQGHHDAKAAIDGHLWLHPQNAARFLDAIAHSLSDLDPANAQTYRANAQDAQAEIAALAGETEDLLAPVAANPFLVFHDAYHYFETAFGVRAVAAITLADDEPASAARLAEVRDVVAETGATCVLVEPRANSGLVDAVTRDTGLRAQTVDAIGVEIPLGADYYPALIRQIGQGLRDCLSASS